MSTVRRYRFCYHRRAMEAARVLRYARRRAGLTQRALALRAGVPQPAIARIERGAVSPRVVTLAQLLAAAGYSLEVTPRLGVGVDPTLIRASLGRAPEDRIRAAARASRKLAAFQEAVARGPGMGRGPGE
jgi:transcriptional regulator with XRE-family HTH domain